MRKPRYCLTLCVVAAMLLHVHDCMKDNVQVLCLIVVPACAGLILCSRMSVLSSLGLHVLLVHAAS
jgi:hypothetical protein